MIKKIWVLGLVLLVSVFFGGFVSAGGYTAAPFKEGSCVKTKVSEVSTRLIDTRTNKLIPGSGSAIRFTNGIALVSYDTIPEVERSHPGDRVLMCLESIPFDCPPGDDRGKVYSVRNKRTNERFELSDSTHMCGGA